MESDSLFDNLRQNAPVDYFTFADAEDRAHDLRFYREILAGQRKYLTECRTELEKYLNLSSEETAEPDAAGYETALDLLKLMTSRCDQLEKLLALQDAAGHSAKMHEINRLFRALQVLKISFIKTLGWYTTPYIQATKSFSFPTESYGGLGERYNYARSNSVVRNQLGECWHSMLGFDPEQQGIIPTSSGMTAFSLVENYLTSEILSPKAVVFVPRFTYQETNMLQFRNTRFFTEIMEECASEAQIVERTLAVQPDVLLLESLQNGIGTRLFDLRKVLAELTPERLNKTINVVIDDSLLPGIFNPFPYEHEKLKAYYTLSASKYFQLGLDISLGGAVVVRKELEDRLLQVSAMGGYSLADVAAASFPILTRDLFVRRQQRLTRNGYVIASILKNSLELRGKVEIFSPLMESSPDFQFARSLPWCGGLVTINFLFERETRSYRNMQVFHDWCRSVVGLARERNIEISCSESFAFPDTRINALGWCYESRMPPFIRVSPGEEIYSEAVKIGQLIEESLSQFIRDFGQVSNRIIGR